MVACPFIHKSPSDGAIALARQMPHCALMDAQTWIFFLDGTLMVRYILLSLSPMMMMMIVIVMKLMVGW